MAMLWFLSIVTLLALYAQTEAQIYKVSPCPRFFVYEGKSPEPDRWYGIVTLLSDVDLSSVWLRLIFDRPSLQLGNWFGQVETTDNKEYIIKNRQAALKANKPQTVRFFIRYDTSEPPPQLLSFRLNARTVCPEDSTTEIPPVAPQTSPSEVGVGGGGEVIRPGGGFNVGGPSSSTEEEDYFPGDFSFFNRPQLDPIDHENLNEICGTVAAKPRPLITHGQETREGEYPWHAALYHAKGIDLTYICGASLISKYHVLTVAHCVTRRKSREPLSPANLVVYLGKYYLKRFSSAGTQDRQVSDIFPYPQYDPQTYSHDIALVKFTEAADITDYVRPVCLWQESPDLSTVLKKLGSVVGWGFDETGKVTEELMQTKMPVVSQDTCLFSYPDFYSRFTTSNTFCAGFKNGTSVCNGDSGGGMVFPKPNSNPKRPRWQIRGLVSISVALQNQFKCDTSHYVVFTDSAKYLDWIRKTMQK